MQAKDGKREEGKEEEGGAAQFLDSQANFLRCSRFTYMWTALRMSPDLSFSNTNTNAK